VFRSLDSKTAHGHPVAHGLGKTTVLPDDGQCDALAVGEAMLS